MMDKFIPLRSVGLYWRCGVSFLLTLTFEGKDTTARIGNMASMTVVMRVLTEQRAACDILAYRCCLFHIMAYSSIC
jgi:hypothetical protein